MSSHAEAAVSRRGSWTKWKSMEQPIYAGNSWIFSDNDVSKLLDGNLMIYQNGQFWRILAKGSPYKRIIESNRQYDNILYFLVQIPPDKMDMTSLEERPQAQPNPLSGLTLQAAYQELTGATDPLRISDLTQTILTDILKTQGIQFQQALQALLLVFTKGDVELLGETSLLAQKIMSYFVSISKNHNLHENNDLIYRRFFLMSILAEMTRQKPQLQMPFSREFLMELFEIEAEEISLEARPRVLAILGVLFANLCRQSSLVRGLKIGKSIKEAILANYSYIQESFTFKLFNKCILDLQVKRLATFSLAELERYGIKKALIKTMGGEKVQLLEKFMGRLFSKKQN